MADWTSSAMFQCWRIIAFLLLCVSVHCVQDLESCLEVKKTYAARGFPESDIPRQAVIGDSLEVCAQQETCCPRSLEERLKSLSHKEHSAHLDSALSLLKTVFTSKTRKFDQFFTELLDNARSELHEMFVKTYGLLYQQNADIFTDLFNDLRAYYKGQEDHNLAEVMDSFFSKLLQKMFTLLNVQYNFDDDYLMCVTERMNDLKPFGEVPIKLSIQIKRAFIAARTFVQGLAIGRDVILNIMEIPPTEQCVKGVLRMAHCPKCQGLTQTRPCNNLCLNTMKGCLAHHAELNPVWNSYIDALKNLAKRLEGPFNIESVVDPIDVKISDAIMIMQENSEQVSTRIFNGCGKPPMARKKRAADENINIYNFDFSSKPRPRPTTAAGTSLDRLVKDIKEKVKTAKDFWVRLPYSICNDEEVAAPPDSNDCWNGHNRARYVPNVQKDGVMNQIDNPEVEVDVSRANTLFTRQVIQLRLITSRLNLAYNGEDVDWIDIPDAAMSGSGSGDDASLPISSSGSGSGGGDDSHWDSDDEDDFRVDNKPRPKGTPYPPYFTRPPHSGGGGGGKGVDGGGGRKPTTPEDKGDGGKEGSGGGSVVRAPSWTVMVVACVWCQLLLLLPQRWS